MATMTRHGEKTAGRPTWPEENTTREGETIDLRHERDERDDRNDRDHADRVGWTDDADRRVDRREAVEVEGRRRPSMGWRVLRVIGFVVAAALLCGVAVIAGVNNTDEVRIDALYDTLRVPIWGTIALAAAAGFVAGRLLDSRRC